MAALVPAIHVLCARGKEDVDARGKPGHDGGEQRVNFYFITPFSLK